LDLSPSLTRPVALVILRGRHSQWARCSLLFLRVGPPPAGRRLPTECPDFRFSALAGFGSIPHRKTDTAIPWPPATAPGPQHCARKFCFNGVGCGVSHQVFRLLFCRFSSFLTEIGPSGFCAGRPPPVPPRLEILFLTFSLFWTPRLFFSASSPFQRHFDPPQPLHLSQVSPLFFAVSRLLPRQICLLLYFHHPPLSVVEKLPSLFGNRVRWRRR